MSRCRQLDIFLDWIPPPPRPASRRPRRDLAERSMDMALRVRPSPVTAYRLSVTHGFDACAERWSWCSRSDLGRLISQGRALTRGERSEKTRRPLTPAQEAEVFEAVQELGGVAYASAALGLNESMVRTIVRERGAYPRASARASDRAAAAERLAAWQSRRAA